QVDPVSTIPSLNNGGTRLETDTGGFIGDQGPIVGGQVNQALFGGGQHRNILLNRFLHLRSGSFGMRVPTDYRTAYATERLAENPGARVNQPATPETTGGAASSAARLMSRAIVLGWLRPVNLLSKRSLICAICIGSAT